MPINSRVGNQIITGKRREKLGLGYGIMFIIPVLYKYKKSLFRVAAKKRLFVMYRGVIRSGV
jgi:hypothetical protein